MGLRDWRGSALPGQPPDLDLIFVIPRALISGGGALALLAVRTPSEGDRACPGELDLLVKKTVALESASHPPTKGSGKPTPLARFGPSHQPAHVSRHRAGWAAGPQILHSGEHLASDDQHHRHDQKDPSCG
jgi:hypothetical protein